MACTFASTAWIFTPNVVAALSTSALTASMSAFTALKSFLISPEKPDQLPASAQASQMIRKRGVKRRSTHAGRQAWSYSRRCALLLVAKTDFCSVTRSNVSPMIAMRKFIRTSISFRASQVYAQQTSWSDEGKPRLTKASHKMLHKCQHSSDLQIWPRLNN